MQKLLPYSLLIGRVIGIGGGIWFLYQLLTTIQRAGHFFWRSPISNLSSLGIGLILGVLLLLPWKLINKYRLWYTAFSFFIVVSVLYLTWLIFGARHAGGLYVIVAGLFLTVQGLCFWVLGKESRTKASPLESS